MKTWNKQTFCMAAVTLFLLMISGVACGADYQSMTTEELSALRGTLFNATQEERDAFRAEWLSRVEKMTPEERQNYLSSGPGNGAGRRDGSGLGSGGGMGRGGSGGGNGAGKGAGNGKGNK